MNKEKEIEFATNFATDFLKERGSVFPMFHAFLPDGTSALFAVPWRDQDEKQWALSMLRVVFMVLKVQRYLFYSECWFASCPEGVDPVTYRKGLPRNLEDFPGRREGLTILWVSKTSSASVNFEIIRTKEGKLSELKKMAEVSSSTGQMMELLPGAQDVPSLDERRIAEKMIKEFGIKF